MMNVSLWKFRTTVIKMGETWRLCDLNEPLEMAASFEMPLPNVVSPVETLTLMSRHRVTLEQVRLKVPEGHPEVGPEEGFESVITPATPVGVQDDSALSDHPEELGDPPPALIPVVSPEPEGILIDGVSLTADSSAQALRQACRNLGVGTSGSKQILYKRLKSKVARRELEDQLALTEAARPSQRDPDIQPAPVEPTEAERALHELTHIPYQPWCPACVAGRARRDQHRSEASRDAPERSVPVISVDWFYVVGNNKSMDFMKQEPNDISDSKEPTMTVLACIDRSTGMVQAVPVPNKSKDARIYAAKQVLTFISYLGYGEIQLRHDNEPSMSALASMISVARAKHGLRTLPRPSQPYVHESNGVVEQCIQTLRDMAVVHLEQIRDHAGQSFSASQDIVGWSLLHAAFLHNAFRVQGGSTPYERCFGIQYRGNLARFGEVVMCALSTAHVKKGKPKFVKMIFLGRTLQNNMYVCGTSLGIYLSSTIRRLPPSQQWARDLLKGFSGKPWTYGLAVLGNRLVPGLPTRNPVPALEAAPVVIPRMPQRADPGPDEAASDPPSTAEDQKDPVEAPDVEVSSPAAEHEGPGDHAEHSEATGAAASSAAPEPGNAEPEPMKDVLEGSSKRPAGEALSAPPFFAGEPPRASKLRIKNIIVDGEELFDYDEGPVDFEFDWGDEDVEDHCGSHGGEAVHEFWSGRTEDEGPPECDEQQLQQIDREAERVEADRLVRMNVLEPVDDPPSADLVLQTRYVLDWRFRDGWKRRARLVSKELKVWDPHRVDVYAPSTSPAMIKIVPALFATMQHEDWHLWGIDIKDAFLTVPQRSLLYVRLGAHYYKVLMCLPGQRQAGAWWCEQITQDLIDAGLHQNRTCPVAFGNGHA